MLSELEQVQDSDESIWAISLSFEVETRSETSDELIHRTYHFGYADEWDKWIFHEFEEKRANNTVSVKERNWHEAEHILWHDADETPSVDVPPEVTEKLQEATGAESIVMQTPATGKRTTFNEIYVADD